MRSTQLLTTTQAAKVAQVAPTTLKRWADDGRLSAVRTSGGHRRFRRMDIERLLREDQVSGAPGPYQKMIATLVGGARHEIDSMLLDLRDRLGTWHGVADELGLLLRELGQRWERSQLTIADEHASSHHLVRALARVVDSLPYRFGTGPCCVLACPGDEDHTIGLALAELCLREAGWRALWLGRRTPASELVSLLETHTFDMIALSASSFASDRAKLEQVVDTVGRACQSHGVRLVLGGSATWPAASNLATRLVSFGEFHDCLTEVDRV